MIINLKSIDNSVEEGWKNLAPTLIRQRLIIEATTEQIVTTGFMEPYLLRLAELTSMQVIKGPYSYSAGEMGYGGGIYWKSSGAHIHSYHENPPLLTVDIYTCKPFSVQEVIKFTEKYFSTKRIRWLELQI